MFKKLLQHKFQIVFFLFTVLGFALIRNYESILFYDPLLVFFKGEYAARPIPEVIEWKLYLSLFLRYMLNTILSVFLIYVLFKNQEHVKIATALYVFFFIILMFLFIVFFKFFSDKVMALFYIRRFLIQPIFLLLFLPGFYFQQENSNK